MEINTKDFVAILEDIKDGISNKGIVEDYARFLFRKGKIFTTNDDVILIRKNLAVFENDFGVKADELLSLMKKVSAEKVDAIFDGDEFQMKWKNAEVGMRYYDLPESYIDKIVMHFLKAKWSNIKVKKLPSDFVKALNLVKSCASKDMTNEALSTVHFASNYIEASDNYSIARYQFEEDIFDSQEFLMPLHNTIVIAKNDPYWLVDIDDDSRLFFMNKDKTKLFGCRVHEGEYPDTEKFLYPDEEGDSIKFSRTMIDAINRAEVFTSEDDALPLIEITVEKNRMLVSTEKEEGWYREKQRIKYEGEDFYFKVVLDSLREILEKTDTGRIHARYIRFVTDQFIFINAIV